MESLQSLEHCVKIPKIVIYTGKLRMTHVPFACVLSEEPEVPENEAALLEQALGGGQAPVPQGPAPDIRSLLLGGVQGG